MSKRRFIATLGAASVLMLAAGPGGFFDSETATGRVASGTLVLGLDSSGGESSNDCTSPTRGATGEVAVDLTEHDDRDGYTVDRVLCIRNLGSGRGAAALQARVTEDREDGCAIPEGRQESGEGKPSPDDCGTDGELDDRFQVALLQGRREGSACHADGAVAILAPRLVRTLESQGATELFEVPAGGLACVVLRIEAEDADPTMMTDVFAFELTFTLESR